MNTARIRFHQGGLIKGKTIGVDSLFPLSAATQSLEFHPVPRRIEVHSYVADNDQTGWAAAFVIY